MTASRDRQSGFTLVEILVALVIFAMVLMTFLRLRTNAVEDAGTEAVKRPSRRTASIASPTIRIGEKKNRPVPGEKRLPPRASAFGVETPKKPSPCTST